MQTDIVQLSACGFSDGTILHARLRQRISARSGNLVGLDLQLPDFRTGFCAGDYMEVTFCGHRVVVQLNKFIQGVQYRGRRQARHSVPSEHVVRRCQLTRNGIVNDNGQGERRHGASQSQSQAGLRGGLHRCVVASGARVHFDSVTLTPPETGAPSEL